MGEIQWYKYGGRRCKYDTDSIHMLGVGEIRCNKYSGRGCKYDDINMVGGDVNIIA